MSLHERHGQILDNCVESLKIWKQLIVDYLDEEDTDTELKKLQQVTIDYCDITNNFQKSARAIQKVEEQLNDHEGATKDVDQLYRDSLENEPESSNGNHTDNEFWQKIFQNMTDVMEVKQKKHVLDDSQYDEVGDSVLCSNVFAPPIDPISKMVIRNPYRNKKCKHVYEYSMIVDYIKQKRKTNCPYIGCKCILTMRDLVEDSQLQSQITLYLETQQDEGSEEEDL